MTLQEVMLWYDDLRRKYFMDAEPPLRVPPPASELQWYWLPERADCHAETELDDHDGDPVRIGVDPWFRGSRRYLVNVLLHELTHIRDPRIECGDPTRKRARVPAGWRREQARLAALGARLL